VMSARRRMFHWSIPSGTVGRRRLEAVKRQTGPRMITLEDFKVNQVVEEKFFTTLCMVTDR
jgi:hypothetical protein